MENKHNQIHPIVHAVSHKHFTRGFHLGAVSISVWAVMMAWMTAVTFTDQVQIAQAAGIVTGRVMAGGSPVGPGKVSIMIMKEGQPPAASTDTDSSGNFSLVNIPSGSDYTVQVYVANASFKYLTKSVKGVTVVDGGTNLGDITLTAASKTLTGKVLRADGQPVTDAQVNVFTMGGGPESSFYSGNTDSTGTFNVYMGPGTYGYQLQATWDQQTGQPKEVDWVYSQAGEGPPPQITFSGEAVETQTVNFTVKTATVRVKGKIVFPDGSPAQFTGVNLRSSTGSFANGSTRSDGTFSLNTTAGSYEFSIFLPPEKSQFSGKSSNFTAVDNQTIDLGTITLKQKTARITGKVTDSTGTGIRNASVNAFARQPGGPGGDNKGPSGPPAFTQTAIDGTYTLYVDAGTLGINLFLNPELGYIYSEPPRDITIAENQTINDINFVLQKADVTINGSVVNAGGAPVTDFYGHANLEDGTSKQGPGKYLGGGHIQNGSFRILTSAKSASRVCIGAYPPPDSRYSVKERTCLDIATGQTYSAKLVLASNDATLTGKVVDKSGNVLSDVRGDVFLNGPAGHRHGRIENGAFSISVASNTKWNFGHHLHSSQYLNEHHFDEIKISAGVNTKNIVLTKSDATITGKLLDPDGNTIPFGFVHAHEPFDPSKKGEPGKGPRGFGGPVQNGTFSIPAAAGKYEVGAGLPPEYSNKGWMPPEFKVVSVASNGTANVNLQFGKSDGSVSGSVTDADGQAVQFGFCGGWSKKGSHTGAPVQDGKFTIQLKKGDVWHLNCNTFENNKHYTSGEVTITAPATTGFALTQNFKLKESPFTPPEPISETFDSSQPKIISVGEGDGKYSISIPAGALDDSGNVQLVVKPTESVQPTENDKIPTGFGLDVTAFDADGNAITNLNSNVTITMPAFCEDLEKEAGIEVDDLKSKYYDSTSGAWQDQTGSATDADGDGQACEYSVTTDHFTTFALTTSSEGSASAKKVTIGKNKKGFSTFTVDGTTVTPFACKGTLKAKTAIINNAQYVAAGTTCHGSVKIYDDAGKLQKEVKTGWKGVNGLAMVDVTKDSAADVIAAPVSAKDIKVIDVKNKYKTTSVTAAGGNAQMVANAYDFSGSGTYTLVIGQVRGGKVGGFKLMTYDKKKKAFTATTSTYASFLKDKAGDVTLSLPTPAVKGFNTSTISKSKKNVTLTVSGSGFTPDMTITVNGISGKVSYVSPTQVKVTIDGTKLKKGSYAVKLMNKGNSKTATSKSKVTVK